MAIANLFEAPPRWNDLALEIATVEKNGGFKTKEYSKSLATRPRVASFFAGAGGMDLGLSWAGFNLVYANEIDNGASETYRNNLGHHIETKSITDVGFKGIPDHDILVGGFPCQPFSYAGRRKGLRDERGLLFRADR